MTEVFLISSGDEDPSRDDIKLYVSEMEKISGIKDSSTVTKIRNVKDITKLDELDKNEIGMIIYPNVESISNGVSFRPEINTIINKVSSDSTVDAERINVEDANIVDIERLKKIATKKCRSGFARL